MKLRRAVFVIVALFGVSGWAAAAVDCMNEAAALAYWQPIRDEADRDDLPTGRLALELVSCLGSPNPELRDRIGYELFAKWLRADALSDATRKSLLRTLSDQMANTSADAVLSRSFSALILAELMRSDGLKPFMTDNERQDLLGVAGRALQSETDYRGLTADTGWIHPVAHMADLHWRFALHPATTSEQAEEILQAVYTQVAPTTVSYAFNESDRLARVVATIIMRGLVDAETLGNWILSYQEPQSMERWSAAFQSPAGMAELHNTKQFLRALSDQLLEADVAAEISEPLNALVNGFTNLI